MSGQPSCANRTPLVALSKASKRYGSRTVLQLDAFELHHGDSLLIVGANGSGKSTLLRVLAGVSALSSGTVRHSPAFDALNIGYVPQSGGLHPNLSVADNLRLSVRLRGRREPDRLEQRWYVGGLDLGEHLRTRYRDLSGGFQRLSALSCVLATEPAALFVDEPLSGVDVHHAHSVVAGLAAAMSHLEVLVLTSHAASDFPSANRVIGLRGGVLA